MEFVINREELVQKIKKQCSQMKRGKTTLLCASRDGSLSVETSNKSILGLETPDITIKERLDAEVKAEGSVSIDSNLIIAALTKINSDTVSISMNNIALFLSGDFTIGVDKRLLQEVDDIKADFREIGRFTLPAKTLAEVYFNSLIILGEVDLYNTMYLYTKGRKLYAIAAKKPGIGAVSYAPIDFDKEMEILLALNTISPHVIKEMTQSRDNIEVAVYADSTNRRYVVNFSDGDFALTYTYSPRIIRQFRNFLPVFLTKDKVLKKIAFKESDFDDIIYHTHFGYNVKFRISGNKLEMETASGIREINIENIEGEYDNITFSLNAHDVVGVISIVDSGRITMKIVGGAEEVINNVPQFNHCSILFGEALDGAFPPMLPDVTVYLQ